MSRPAGQRAAFVTGAAGCIGSALSRRLAQTGWRVIALVRDRERAAHLAVLPGVELPGIELPGIELPGIELPGIELPGIELPGIELPGIELPGIELPGIELPGIELPGIELIEGELEERSRLVTAMRGCEVVFHLAAKVHAQPGTPEADFRRVNIDGTRHVIAAALENRVKSLVFFSTAAVYPESDEVFDESSPTAPATAYGASKLAAEELVLDTGAAERIKATVLRLPVVYGARDRGNVGKLIEAVARGRYAIIGAGANLKSMVAVENVVDAALLVAKDERARGQIYLVCDARAYTQREIAAAIAEALHRRSNLRRLPRWPLLMAGRVADLVSKLTNVNLPLSADRVRKLTNNTCYSAAKIERELGFTPSAALRDVLPEIINSR